ncbi:MAG: cysteine synthase [Patescibacteria group bacterium]
MNYPNLLNTIGNTPVVEISRYSRNRKVKILAKLEGTNPGGSVKDRVALYLINDAENRRVLKENVEIIEATSGNTGIGLAMVSAIKGYQFTAVMPGNASIERREVLEAYGAKVILTDGGRGTNYAIQVALNLVKENPGRYFMPNQFDNPANVLAHYQTTGREIIQQVPEVTAFVAGMGTGGTLMGVGQKLKEYRPEIFIVGVEPDPGSKIQGLRNMTAYTPKIFDPKKLDCKLNVPDNAAFDLVRDLFRKEGISAGISSGAALWGAIELSGLIKSGVIVTIFPDRGDRYLSTGIFSG